MKIEGKILATHVYLLSFDTQYELCMSFVRMQEFYDNKRSKKLDLLKNNGIL